VKVVANKILIANRGEIAVRIIRACKELGIPTVAVYSLADKKSLHVKIADEAICIGKESSKDSYLNINSVLSAAISTGCNAIHPGYGFLSENSRFAEMVESCNLIFIGPSSKIIAAIGDKAMAKKLAIEAGVPVVEGSDGIIENVEDGIRIAQKIGYPVMIKASSGGGGRGITIVHNDESFVSAFAKSSLEAETSFGDKSLYIEKYIEKPHHIEVQILGDKFGNIVHLGERDCSIQRRNQKIIEESPSTYISLQLRRKLYAASLKLAKAIGYHNAGTLEFLVDTNENFYFMEMNTRIQVEHGLTEFVTGIDLIKEQIRIAYGSAISFKQTDIEFRGHAIEARICAEDPYNNFRPTPGVITNVVFPGGPGVRIDTHIYSGYEISQYYDSLLGKLIVHAPTRREAIRKIRSALEQFVIEGITNNVEYLFLLMHQPEFIKGQVDTGFIARFTQTVEGELNARIPR
jgi:acetyl-CoA carboxylase, biotin carboxylase subunit